MNKIFKKVLVSEKSYQDASVGKFSFVVDQKTSKEEVAKEVEKLFKVNVLKANSMNYEGKIKQTKRKTGKRCNFKKVILTLKAGQKIDLFEIEGDDKNKRKEMPVNTDKTKVEVKTREKSLIRRAIKRVSGVNKTMEG